MDTQNLLNHLVTAVLVIDSGLKPCFANAAAEQLLGTGSHRLSEQALTDIFQLQEVPATILADAVRQGLGLTVNTASLVTFDGQHHTVDLTLIPLENEPGLSLLELRQVDQQRRIHQQLTQDAQQQAAQFLVRNLAHEIKNPLGGLRGAAQLLSRELEDESLKEFTTLIIEQADRMRALVDKLLGPQKPTAHLPHNIHEVAEKVIKLVELSAPANIRVIRDYDPSIPDIDLDADQMQQALLNIVQNAVQALENGGGTITVRTRTSHQVTLGAQRHKLVLMLSVIDDGPGIPPELMDTLFYPMVTGREQGSGLGLSIAHNIARLHGGRIDCDSAPGHTQFVLTLPIKTGK
ncbi:MULTISPECIES: nitrogen regulation protein NR(II) [Shewanella]|uniref:nitrogen regulation protein NR(II) n=1 Tax=Shewanella TaxID=22 RepID=UPI001C654C6F|nr:MULTISPECIES: nitrogen regulation protein NR(II) [Shewanella]QYJ75180.1 nitrogen regulation protein NR(II) [Shewanella sp. FJAT-52076]QYK05051.1 nitrogen regulation protein NR(II) [Shewanella zhangzhouensis]